MCFYYQKQGMASDLQQQPQSIAPNWGHLCDIRGWKMLQEKNNLPPFIFEIFADLRKSADCDVSIVKNRKTTSNTCILMDNENGEGFLRSIHIFISARKCTTWDKRISWRYQGRIYIDYMNMRKFTRRNVQFFADDLKNLQNTYYVKKWHQINGFLCCGDCFDMLI